MELNFTVKEKIIMAALNEYNLNNRAKRMSPAQQITGRISCVRNKAILITRAGGEIGCKEAQGKVWAIHLQ